MQPITYDDIQRLLEEEHAPLEAAEAHGILAGALSATTHYFFEDWLRDIAPEGAIAPHFSDSLQAVHQRTAEALEGMSMDFELLLPDDEEPIAVRVAALAGWCRGFLQGFNSNATLDIGNLPDEIGEVLNDFNDIIDVDSDGVSEEEGEDAYMELSEFVRVGVQLIFDELRALRAQESASLN